MIKLTQLLSELGINDPNKLVKGKKYQVYNDISRKWEILEFDSEYANRWVFNTEYGNKNVGKNYYIKNNWIKPYKEEINELGINKPEIKLIPDKKYKVWDSVLKSWDNYDFIGETKLGGIRLIFRRIKNNTLFHVNKQYYLQNNWIKPYKEEINELEVENPNKNWKQVWAMYCYLRQDYHWDELYEKAFKKYDVSPAYRLKGGGIPSFIRDLSQQQLNKLYRELKQLDTYGK